MKFHRVLDVVLSSAAKVKVLRSLVLRPYTRSGRAIAREVALSHAQVGVVLEDLHQVGLVHFSRVGRSHAYTLRRETYVAREILIPLFEKERDLFESLTREIASAIQTPTVSVFAFGSSARQEDHPESDLDLAIIVKGQKERESVLDEVAGEVANKASTLGVRLDCHVYTQRDFRQKYAGKEKFIREIVSQGRRIAGAYPLEVVSGSAKGEHPKR